MLESLLTAENLVALATLTGLEIVLGIDNIIFISILSAKLPLRQQAQGRRLGIGLAVGSRILLLLMITWIMELTQPLFALLGHSVSGRDLILLVGGLFLIGKSTYEIHERLEFADRPQIPTKGLATLGAVMLQIVIIDVVFSLDSVITAVGISGQLVVMVPAIVIAAMFMLVFAGAVSRFIDRHPTMKVLALAFLILIGAVLVIEGWAPEVVHDSHLKNYAYFAMAFSFCVEMVNMRLRRAIDPIRLRNQPRVPKGQLPLNLELGDSSES
jgi:predicted tellurium resistance membrane protein TerC